LYERTPLRTKSVKRNKSEAPKKRKLINVLSLEIIMAEKLAIIMSGGGMKSSFGVGVILALAEKYNITEPFLLICGSGSAGTGSYYISKQYKSIRNIWTNLVSSKNFLSWKRFWKIIDIDYLIYVIFKKQDPLKEKLIYASKTRYLIPALNKNTGNIDYFDNQKGMDVFENMRATKAMPIAFKMNPSIKINGSVYCDSLVSSRAETHIQKAIDLGANKILIINNISYQKKGLDNLFFSLWIFFQKCKKQYYEIEKKSSNHQIPEDVKIFTIAPKSKLKITTLNNNIDLLRQTIDQGYQETISNNKLKSFLK
jgi:predicted patatin/cPLA2 family phospholipase